MIVRVRAKSAKNPTWQYSKNENGGVDHIFSDEATPEMLAGIAKDEVVITRLFDPTLIVEVLVLTYYILGWFLKKIHVVARNGQVLNPPEEISKKDL